MTTLLSVNKMNAQELYDKLKDALRLFGLSFFEMDQVQIINTQHGIGFYHDHVTIHLHIEEHP